MNKCIKCGKELTKDEMGLHKKLFNRAVESFMCIDCCAAYLNVQQKILKTKINEFKAMGCTLFK